MPWVSIVKTNLAVVSNDIQNRLFSDGFPAPYIKGFVVIQSPASLDVTAVYTAAFLNDDGRPASIVSMDVEQITERQMR